MEMEILGMHLFALQEYTIDSEVNRDQMFTIDIGLHHSLNHSSFDSDKMFYVLQQQLQCLCVFATSVFSFWSDVL